MTNHVDLPESQLHEPKGVSTASAGKVYVADGAGSGAWQTQAPEGVSSASSGSVLRANGIGGVTWLKTDGFSQYQDSRVSAGTPTIAALASGVRTLLPCDGGTSILNNLPEDASEPLWNTTSNKHIPIAVNDTYTIRVGFIVENFSGTRPSLDLELDIGGTIGTIFHDSRGLRKSGGVQDVSFQFPVYTGTTYVPNGGEFYVTYEGSGTIDIHSVNIFIRRDTKAYT